MVALVGPVPAFHWLQDQRGMGTTFIEWLWFVIRYGKLRKLASCKGNAF